MLARSIIAAALVAAGIAATPSAAYATSAAYTPEKICGKGFKRVKDGHRAMKTPKGSVYGHVYLTYNKRSGRNCVAAIKTVFAGTRTVTGVRLAVKGGGKAEEVGRFRHYAETGHLDGRWKCVTYEGWTRDPDDKVRAWGGRTTWGNCGG